MIKVFLVEDEVIVRTGIKKQIKWEREGFEFVGEASDGELAFPMIQQLKPDIIITDIKMPFMDGLQLSKLVKKEFPNIKIIVLSGYNDFVYAKEAISIGVTEYLLKPIGSEELLSAVIRVRDIIYEEQIEKENVALYKMERQESEKGKTKRFYHDLVTKKIPIQEVLEQCKELNLDLVAHCYNIMLTTIFQKDNDIQKELEDFDEVKQELIKQIEGNSNVIIFDRNNEGMVFFVKGENHEGIGREIDKVIDYFQSQIHTLKNIEYFIGVGSEVCRLSEISQSFDNASKAFAYRYIVERNQVIYSEQINKYHIVKDLGIDIKQIDVNKLDKTIVESFLRTGATHEVRHFIEDYFGNLGEKNTNSFLFCQYITYDMYFSSISFMEEMGFGVTNIVEHCGDLKNMSSLHISLKEIIDYLEKVFSIVIEYRDQSSLKKYYSILSTAKEYINDNFSADDISLNIVAKKVNVSTSHFSTIFSKEIGCSFIQYLTEIRMNKAKELLRCSSMKSSEIGYAVGYKDPHYFSCLFKKTQGCTPKDFRMRGKEKNE